MWARFDRLRLKRAFFVPQQASGTKRENVYAGAMTLDSPLFEWNGRTITLFEVAAVFALLALLLLIVAVWMVWRGSRSRLQGEQDAQRRTVELELRLAELAGSLQSFASQAQGNTVHLQRSLDERLDAVSQRVGMGLHEQSERTAVSLGQLNERLAVIDAAQRNITSLSTEMISLKDILNNKQSRGAFGQGRMEAIIKDGLHAAAYEFQATLSNGTRPDCVISLPDSALRLVIDAKFPLESYSAMRDAEDDLMRKAAEGRLRVDMAKHVKDISEKYLLSGETHETAIMFVPSESIYAELNEKFDDVVQKAHRARVILASPNVLMLLVQTMQAIFKDVAMRDQAHVIKAEVGKLMEDVGRLKERASNLRRHFDQANGDLEQLNVSADRITKRGLKIENLDLEESKTGEALNAPRPRLVNTN
jgi:DNA recombination protein RmuC